MSGESAMSEEQRDELDALAEICIGDGEFEVRVPARHLYTIQHVRHPSWFLAGGGAGPPGQLGRSGIAGNDSRRDHHLPRVWLPWVLYLLVSAALVSSASEPG